MSPKRTFPKEVYNFISLTGVGLALFGLAAIIILYLLNLMAGQTNPYLGIFIFLAFPGVLVLGLLLIPLGMWRERRRLARGQSRPLSIDLGNSHHRNAVVVFVAGTSVFLLLSTVGLYQGYQYTESIQFCGSVCHPVMTPEKTAYHNSPPATVKCVHCHIGPGADWYVRSKLSGARQVFKTALNIYPRPIETPIVNLRPAQEVCEECHWPDKFFPATAVTRDYYLGDRDNTHWQIRLLMKIGGTQSTSPQGHTTGIHWHVAEENRMTYVSSDSSRQSFDRVVWMRDGQEVVYTRDGVPMPDSVLAGMRRKGWERSLDCMDCHNRPSHRYKSPLKAINEAMAAGRLDSDIPWIKRRAVMALSRHYETSAGARDSIAAALHEFYDGEGIPLPDEAVAAVQEAYAQNMFPEMRVRWDHYPDNGSHFIFDGCFRCHGSDLKNQFGETISADCNLCHALMAQGPGSEASATMTVGGLDFRHPVDIGGGERIMRCTECHIGDDSIYPNGGDLRSGTAAEVEPLPEETPGSGGKPAGSGEEE